MKKQVLLAAVALALSGAASAQAYGVISVGSAKQDIDCGGAAVCDESGTAFKLLGGYRVLPNLAVEGGYMSYGKAKASDAGLSADFTVNGVGIGAAFHQDIATHWNFVARLGLAQMKTKVNATAGGSSGSESDSKAQLYGGLGVGYNISKQLSIDAAWDFSQAKVTGFKYDVNAFSVGLTFGF
jgi:opacity protein-like surface antigen